MVFQSYAIWPHLTVAENIGLVLTRGRLRMSKQSARQRIRESLAMVQLDDYENRPARLLSGGQQQRVALARALAVNPALLLMDEPLSNLDARLREEVRSNIKKLTAQLGITVLYVTHDQVEAMVLADRIAVMSQGQILQIGNPFDLYRSPANSLVAEFFGSINWLRGKMLDPNRVETAVGTLVVENSRARLDAVVIGIRPEDIHWAPASPEPKNRLEGKVVSSIFLGDQAIAEVEINGQALSVKSMPDNQKPTGYVVIELPADKLVVFPDTQSN
jgi:iron(III) transport system ATP-binding protein